MTRTLVAIAAWLALAGPAVAQDPEFTTPPEAEDLVQAEDRAVSVRYDGQFWTVAPRPSKFRMFALVTHSDSNVSGMLVYRGEPESEADVRKRARAELDMFKSHEADFSRRIVNGVPVLYMQAVATKSDGNDVIVRSYYWTGANGVVDYAVIAPRSEFEQHRESVMDLLNGLEITVQQTAY